MIAPKKPRSIIWSFVKKGSMEPDVTGQRWWYRQYRTKQKIYSAKFFWTSSGKCNLQLDWTSKTSWWKINLLTNKKGYDNSEPTAGKLLATRIHIFRVYFCVIHFHFFFQNNFPNNAQTKMYPADLNSARQILWCQDFRPFWGVCVCV